MRSLRIVTEPPSIEQHGYGNSESSSVASAHTFGPCQCLSCIISYALRLLPVLACNYRIFPLPILDWTSAFTQYAPTKNLKAKARHASSYIVDSYTAPLLNVGSALSSST